MLTPQRLALYKLLSLLLSFSLAEVEEGRRKPYREISPIFDALLSKLNERVDSTNLEFDQERDALVQKLKLAAAVETKDQNVEGADGDVANGGAPADADMTDWDGEAREKEREKAREIQQQVEARVEAKREREIDRLKQAISTVYIVYMRIARREVSGQVRL